MYKYIGRGIAESVINYSQNNSIKLTDLERTVVYAINRPAYCGGPYELDEILKICTVLDEEKLFLYLNLYGKKGLYKKAGYYLERYRESLGISSQMLKSIEEKTGNGKTYLSEKALSGEGGTHKSVGFNSSENNGKRRGYVCLIQIENTTLNYWKQENRPLASLLLLILGEYQETSHMIRKNTVYLYST